MVEPIKIVYRRPSNQIFLFNKGYYAYFVNNQQSIMMVYTSTEKKAIDGPFFLEDFFYPDNESNYLFENTNLTIDNFFEEVVFYRDYWLHQLDEERENIDEVVRAIKKFDLKTVCDLFEDKLDINQEYYYSKINAPITFLSYCFEYEFNKNVSFEGFFSSILTLIMAGADLKRTSLIKGKPLFNYIIEMFCQAEDYYHLIYRDILVFLIEYKADYHTFIDGMHPFQKIIKEIGLTALQRFLDYDSDAYAISYFEIKSGNARSRFIIPSQYLADGYFDEIMAIDYVKYLSNLPYKKIQHILTFNHYDRISYFPNIPLKDIIAELDQFETLLEINNQKSTLYDLILDCDLVKIKKALSASRDYLFETIDGKNSCLMALSNLDNDHEHLFDIITLLSSYGLDFNQFIENDRDLSLIVMAALNEKLFLVEHLLKLGVDYELICGGHWTLLDALTKTDEQLFKKGYYLIKQPINYQDQMGHSLFHVACQFGNEKIVKFLLDEGYDANLQNIYGTTPFEVALIIEGDNYHVVKTLVDSNLIDFNYQDSKTHETYLHYSIASCKPYRVKLILDKFEDVNIKNKAGYNPLDFLFHRNKTKINRQDVMEIYQMMESRGGVFAYQTNLEKYQKIEKEINKKHQLKKQVAIVYVMPEETNHELAYEVDNDLEIDVGAQVLVPYGSTELKGEVTKGKTLVSLSDLPFSSKKLKKVIKVL